jgi:hypothetical protein
MPFSFRMDCGGTLLSSGRNLCGGTLLMIGHPGRILVVKIDDLALTAYRVATHRCPRSGLIPYDQPGRRHRCEAESAGAYNSFIVLHDTTVGAPPPLGNRARTRSRLLLSIVARKTTSVGPVVEVVSGRRNGLHPEA